MKNNFVVTLVMLAMSVALILMFSCGGGGGGGGGGETFTPIQLDSPGVVFVTSVTGTGNLGSWADAGGNTGLAAADAICAARAVAGGYSGTFVAWMNDDNDDAYCRIHGLTGLKADNCGFGTLPAAAGPWIRTDDFPFSEAIVELMAGVVYTPVRFDEFGSEVALGHHYFTATDYDGTLQTNYGTCSSWAGSNFEFVGTGSPDATSISWAKGPGETCDDELSLLCMEVGQAPAHTAFAVQGKKVFVSSITAGGNLEILAAAGGNTGAAAGDAICRYLANNAGLANTSSYKAWLSDSGSDAADRITSNGPWVRLDGVPVANSKADLLDGSLFTTINVNENGEYEWQGYGAWTGTLPAGTKTAYTCSDWSDSQIDGTYGMTIYANAYWSEYVLSPDHQLTAKIYCFEGDPLPMINELDSDTPASDTLEFVELYDGGAGYTILDGYTLVFFNGSSDTSYLALDLTTYTTDATGYFVAGNAGVLGVDLVIINDTLQNGPDAVALYDTATANFPNGTALTTTDLIDAIVYDTNDADDAGLLVLMSAGPQVNEGMNGYQTTQSIQRSPNGSGNPRDSSTYTAGTPSPGTANSP